MGICCMKMLLPPGASGVWTIEEIQGQVQQLTHTLPMPEMQPGKVIKLAGQGGIFNTIPPINESWLEGRITNEESVERDATHSAHGGSNRS
jgi:hypothetical protein